MFISNRVSVKHMAQPGLDVGEVNSTLSINFFTGERLKSL
jgi:hypothetical protein